MIIAKELVVSNRKKAELVTELRKRDFTPFPKSKAKEAGENEEVLEDEESTGTAGDYDYLLGMPIWNLTHEKVGVAELLRGVALANPPLIGRETPE